MLPSFPSPRLSFPLLASPLFNQYKIIAAPMPVLSTKRDYFFLKE